MDKVDRLCNRVEPFAVLFRALGIVCTCQHLTLPAGPASLNAVQKACPYMVIVGSILNEDAYRLPPPFLSRLFIYAYCDGGGVAAVVGGCCITCL